MRSTRPPAPAAPRRPAPPRGPRWAAFSPGSTRPSTHTPPGAKRRARARRAPRRPSSRARVSSRPVAETPSADAGLAELDAEVDGPAGRRLGELELDAARGALAILLDH